MTTDIATATTTALAITDNQSEFTESQVAALKQLGVDDAPRGDLDVFFHAAKRTGLDPFNKQIYMIGRNTKVGGYRGEPERWETKYTIQTGIEGYRVVGHRIAKREGLGRPVAKRLFCGRDGIWREILVEDGPPVAAKAEITCDGVVVGEAVVKFAEYAQTTRSGELAGQWRDKPTVMIGKCAEAAAWRSAFPQDFAGIYEPSEFHQVIDGEVVATPVRSERVRAGGVAALREAAAAAQQQTVDQEPAAEPVAGEQNALSPAARRKWINRMFALLGDGDCKSDEDQLIVISSLAGQHYGELLEHRDSVTDDQLRAIVNTLHTAKEGGALDELITDLVNKWVSAVGAAEPAVEQLPLGDGGNGAQ